MPMSKKLGRRRGGLGQGGGTMELGKEEVVVGGAGCIKGGEEEGGGGKMCLIQE